MPSVDGPEAMPALIPGLRAFARTLDPDPGRGAPGSGARPPATDAGGCAMPSVDGPEAMPALIPGLRAFARTLDPDPGRADGLVRDALVAALGDRRPVATADELRARIE